MIVSSCNKHDVKQILTRAIVMDIAEEMMKKNYGSLRDLAISGNMITWLI